MNNSILFITDCKINGGTCDSLSHTVGDSRTATLQLVNVAVTNPAIPQLNHRDSGLTDIATVEFSAEFSADPDTNYVSLVIDRVYPGFSLAIRPGVTPTTIGTLTEYRLPVPSANQPNFNWEFVAKEPGIPLKITVKRK